jgi:choline kinase
LVPYDSNFFDPEELKVQIVNGQVAKILPKKTGRGQCNGSTIGMFKIGARASSTMFNELDRMMAHDAQRRHWFESVLNEVFGKVCFRPRDIVGFKWVEIDTKEDLQKAQGFRF